MSRPRSRRPTASRAARPPTARQIAALEALRAEMRERYDFFQAQRRKVETGAGRGEAG
jgi:hypothetical protein